MSRPYGRVGLIVLALFCLNASTLPAQQSRNAASVNWQEVLSWLPQDTETIQVARGPFALPAASKKEADENENRVVTKPELALLFQSLPLSLFGFKDGLLLARLKGKQIALALEGARHFRPPKGLGQMPYEGCAIALFNEDLSLDMPSFLKANRKSVLKVEQIAGQESAVFQEQLENDVWTAFVVFPNKRTIMVATNRDYLDEVLERMQGKKGNRALPNDLPEWKYVNPDLPVWGLRHYDRSQAALDPSSPFGGQKSANDADEQAIGLTYAFDQSIGNAAKVIYLSGDTNIGRKPDTTLLSMGKGPEADALHIKYREVALGVIEGTYTLQNAGQVQFFFFVFLGMLGQAIFV